MNTITVTNCWAKFKGPNLETAIQLMAYQQDGYFFSKAYKSGHWDGWIHTMNQTGKFPAGLTSWLVDKLALEGIKCEVEEDRPDNVYPSSILEALHHDLDFWPHQLEALERAYEDQRGILWEPTGSGKTDIMIELVARVARPALVLVNRKDLMYQTYKRFAEAYGDTEAKEVVGIVGDGLWEPRLVTIASFQTLYKRLKEKAGIEEWLRYQIGQVHVDEAQHLAAKSFERVMVNLWSARWRYGYSATPFKSEGDKEAFFKVSSWLGPVTHRVEAKTLADKGHLVPVDVFMVRQTGAGRKYGRYKYAVELGIVGNKKRNNDIIKIAHHLDKSRSGVTIILLERIAHGEYLSKMLKCPFISGSSSTKERAGAYEALRTGATNLAIISKIGDEGLDIPGLQYLVLAGGGKADHLTLQRVGRGMRSNEGKSTLFVFDFEDKGQWIEKHAEARRATYANQPAYTVKTVDLKEVLA